MNKTLSENVLMTTLHTMLRLMEFDPNKDETVTAGVSVPAVPIEENPKLVYEIAGNLLDSGNIATWREIATKVSVVVDLAKNINRHYHNYVIILYKILLCIILIIIIIGYLQS